MSPPSYPSRPETATSPEELARLAQAGSSASYAELVGRFQKPLYQFLRYRTQSAADAEEVAHESFVRAWQNLERYDERWRFSTWLYTIARREAASFYRQAQSHGTERNTRPVYDPAPEPVQAMAAEEGRGQLWDLARQVLSTEQFDALWLRYAEDLSPQEIAQTLDRDPSAVRVMLFRARKLLARHLSNHLPSETIRRTYSAVRGA